VTDRPSVSLAEFDADLAAIAELGGRSLQDVRGEFDASRATRECLAGARRDRRAAAQPGVSLPALEVFAAQIAIRAMRNSLPSDARSMFETVRLSHVPLDRRPAEFVPPLEEFYPERGEIFEACGTDGAPQLGIAFVAAGRIYKTTAVGEIRRIGRDYEDTRGRDSKERTQREDRFLKSLPFPSAARALWPLPADPTLESVADWEAANGPLLSALMRYLEERASAGHPGDRVVEALWAIAASVKAEAVDFAPRLLVEGPTGWGKSTTAEAIQLLVPRAFYGAVLTAASIYRIMDQWHPTLLVDESTISEHPEIRQVLRAGFKRGTRIARASQNADSGIVVIDPFGYAILTSLVDLPEDVVNRCFVVRVPPGEPAKRVWQGDPEARRLRTVLARLRLEVLAGLSYPDLAEAAQEARTKPGLERRSRDKLSALWPYAKQYGVVDQLVDAAGRLESDSTEQLAASDKGVVVSALANLVREAGGLTALRAGDLDLVRVHAGVQRVLIAEGEATMVNGEMIVDARKYSPRDFTGRLVREIGLKVKVAGGRSRIDRSTFLVLWPNISSRYGGAATLDDFANRAGEVASEAKREPQEGDTTTPTEPRAQPSWNGGEDTAHHDPYNSVGHPYGIGVGVGITGQQASPSSTWAVDPVESRVGEGRPRHEGCDDCRIAAHHVCEGCPRCVACAAVRGTTTPGGGPYNGSGDGARP
jgi:hypothetical protein